MNLFATTINQFWVRIFDKRRKCSDIMIENTMHTEIKDSFVRIPPVTSQQSVTHQLKNAFRLNYERNYIPVLTIDPYLQEMGSEETDYILDPKNKIGVSSLPLKEDSLMSESANKSFCSSHRLTSSVQMKNHPLRKSTSGFENKSLKARNDKSTMNQQVHTRMSLGKQKEKKRKEVKFKLNSCEDILGIDKICKENEFSTNINDLKSGDFDIEALDSKNVFPIKNGTEEGETAEGKDNFAPYNKTHPVSFEIEDYHTDVTSYLKDMIRKINSVSKGKQVLNLINDELVLRDRVPSPSNQYDRSDDTRIKFISDGNTITSGMNHLEDVVNNSSKFISEIGTQAFGLRNIGIDISQNEVISHNLENEGAKKGELFSRCGLNLVKENDIRFHDKAIKPIESVSTNKTYNLMTASEPNITSSYVNLMTLNLNNYGLYGKPDHWQWRENSKNLMFDVKNIPSKSSLLSNLNYQVSEDRQYEGNAVEKRRTTDDMKNPKHMIMGCCPECKTNPSSYKYFVYNIPQEENKKRNLSEKNIAERLRKYENAIPKSPEKKIEKAGNIFVSKHLNRKPPCSETDKQDHFSGSSDALAYGLHKNVFKKFNPRSLLMFQTPTSKNRTRQWKGAKKVDKSSDILLENGSREFLRKENAKGLIEETPDDESPLVSLRNKSSENLISNSFFKYSNLSSSSEWQSFFEKTFKSDSSNSCGTKDHLDLMKHTQLTNMSKNLPSKLAALGRNGESCLSYWTNSRKKTRAKKSVKKMRNKIKNA